MSQRKNLLFVASLERTLLVPEAFSEGWQYLGFAEFEEITALNLCVPCGRIVFFVIMEPLQ